MPTKCFLVVHVIADGLLYFTSMTLSAFEAHKHLISQGNGSITLEYNEISLEISHTHLFSKDYIQLQ